MSPKARTSAAAATSSGAAVSPSFLTTARYCRWLPFCSCATTSPAISRSRAFMTSAADGMSLRLSLVRAVFSISCSWRYSRGVTKVTAIPERPARPVRPMRWMYPSGLWGML